MYSRNVLLLFHGIQRILVFESNHLIASEHENAAFSSSCICGCRGDDLCGSISRYYVVNAPVSVFYAWRGL